MLTVHGLQGFLKDLLALKNLQPLVSKELGAFWPRERTTLGQTGWPLPLSVNVNKMRFVGFVLENFRVPAYQWPDLAGFVFIHMHMKRLLVKCWKQISISMLAPRLDCSPLKMSPAPPEFTFIPDPQPLKLDEITLQKKTQFIHVWNVVLRFDEIWFLFTQFIHVQNIYILHIHSTHTHSPYRHSTIHSTYSIYKTSHQNGKIFEWLFLILLQDDCIIHILIDNHRQYIWVSDSDLTVTSLESLLVRGNCPKTTLFQVGEIVWFTHTYTHMDNIRTYIYIIYFIYLKIW